MIEVFRDNQLNERFYQDGFLKHGAISTDTVQQLIAISDALNIPDFVGCDFNCGMNSDIFEARKTMQENLKSYLIPFFEPILNQFKVFSTSFVNKNPTDKFLILAHQDFTFTNEPEIPSIMCWIPLIDVDIKNGAIGFIPKSHKLYDYKRPFPFPASYTPIVKNEVDLMEYINIIDMKAGEMVFFFNNTVHGSFANLSNTVRYAINISFYPVHENIYVSIRNPATLGKTFLTYQVDEDFLVKYNNPTIEMMYNSGQLDISYDIVDEEPFGEFDTSWHTVKNKLIANNIGVQKNNLKYINKFRRQQKYHRIKEKIYYKFINKK